jgi:hypothetical protein
MKDRTRNLINNLKSAETRDWHPAVRKMRADTHKARMKQYGHAKYRTAMRTLNDK